MSQELAILIILIALSALFSGSEIAMASLSQAKVHAMKKDKKWGSRAIVKLKGKPENLLIAILIGNNVANILATVIATLWAIRVFGNYAIGIVTGLLTFTLLVFGEITPKALAQKYTEPFARLMAYPLLSLVYVLYPVIYIFNRFIHGLMWLFKAKNPIHTVSEEELLAMVDIGTQEGVIEKREKELIENVLEFTDTTVEEIMTLKKNIKAVSSITPIPAVAKFFVRHAHSRLPVYVDSLDNVIGILTVHDILRLLEKPTPQKTLGDLHYSPLIIVPRTNSISRLFREFQKRHQHLAIIVDEHGSTIGLVTLEDILEEIVGDIAGEQDREPLGIITSIGKDRWEVSGEATIETVNQALKTSLTFPEHQSIGFLVLDKLKRFPKEGEQITCDNLLIQVSQMGKKKIEKVILTKKPSDQDAHSKPGKADPFNKESS